MHIGLAIIKVLKHESEDSKGFQLYYYMFFEVGCTDN
jgi:hypothetical protein